jgi:hypothetical protein
MFSSPTTIGIGTVIGGDIFNLFINVAITIYMSPGRTVRLHGIVFSREMFAFFCSCFLVLWSTREIQKNGHHDTPPFTSMTSNWGLRNWKRCLEIPWQESLVLVLSYIAYCLFTLFGVAVITRSIKGCLMYFRCTDLHNSLFRFPEEDEDSFPLAESTEGIEITLVLNNDNDGLSRINDNSIECEVSVVDDSVVADSATSPTEVVYDCSIVTHSDLQHYQQLRSSIPIAVLDLESSVQNSFLEYNLQYPHFLENFPLFLRSSFSSAHTKVVCNNNPWQLRYFTFNEYGMFYKLDNCFVSSFQGNSTARYINVFQIANITLENEAQFEFSMAIYKSAQSISRISIPCNTNTCRFYYFRAPDRTIYYSVLHKLYWFYEKSFLLHDYELEILISKAK